MEPMFLSRHAEMLRRHGKKFYDLSIGLVPRAKEPYATHVPILVGVAAAYRPKLD